MILVFNESFTAGSCGSRYAVWHPITR